MPKIKRESRSFIVINEEKLIAEVQKRPILYDKALKGYRKPVTRENAWQEVSDLLQSPGKYFPQNNLNRVAFALLEFKVVCASA